MALIDLKMAWRNIWRNPRRSILTLGAMVFATMLLVFMLSLQLGSYDIMIDTTVTIHTGHLQVQAEGYRKNRDIRRIIPEPKTVGEIIRNTSHVKNHAFRSSGFALLSSEERTYGGMVIGVEPEQEAKVSRIEELVQKGDYLSADDTRQALVGRLLAKNLKVGLGDEITMLGQGRDGSIAAMVYTIKGIYSTGQDDFDRSSLYVPIKNFQEVFFMRGAVHEAVVIADSLENLPLIEKELEEKLERLDTPYPLKALTWDELNPGLKQSIQMDLYGGYIQYAVLIVVVAFGILNTFLMAVFERTREFGVLMAIGTMPRRLSKILMTESFLMSLLGIAIGLFIGSVITLYFQSHGIQLPGGTSEIMEQFGVPERIYPKLSLQSASSGPIAVLIITFLTALYPALKVTRFEPVEAMRST